MCACPLIPWRQACISAAIDSANAAGVLPPRCSPTGMWIQSKSTCSPRRSRKPASICPRLRREATIPAKRYGTPEEFGQACAFLCSTHAGFIVGQNILLDGGATNATI